MNSRVELDSRKREGMTQYYSDCQNFRQAYQVHIDGLESCEWHQTVLLLSV